MLLEVADVRLLLADSPACRDGPGLRCTGLTVEGETPAGENYGSTFLKCRALFEDARGGELSRAVVAKRLPPTEYLRKTFNVDVSFPKEVDFYRLVVPTLLSLQAEVGVPEAERLRCFPALYGARVGGKDPTVVDDDAILVLEDLAHAGYYCGDRHRGLDMDHCKLAVLELARFHAAGIALRALRPAVFDGAALRAATAFFMHDRLEESVTALEAFQNNCLAQVLEHVPEVLAVADEPRLRRAAMTIRPHTDDEDEDRAARTAFTTITHEDFWVNNMMFARGEDGRPERLMMVDFQLTEVASAARDLLFFVFSSADSAALARADELLRAYHEELVRYVRLHGLDADGLGWDVLRAELDREARAEFSHLFYMVNIIRAQNKVEKADTHSDEVFSKELGISEPARERYMELLREWVRRGWM